MDFDDRDRYDDAPPSHRVTCPHCRGSGVILKSKLSSGQIRKIELDEAGGEGAKPRPLLDFPPTSTQTKPSAVTKEMILYQKTDTISPPARKEAFNPRRSAPYFDRGPAKQGKMPDYLKNDPGPSRSDLDYFRRSDYADWKDTYAAGDGDEWAGNGGHWRSGGGQTWRDPLDKFDDSPVYDEEFGKKKRKRKKAGRRPDNFGGDEWGVGPGPGPGAGPGAGPGPGNFPPPYARQPRSLMSDQVNPPMPLQRPVPPPAAFNMHQGPRKRSRGPNFGNMPARDDGDELSDVDIFSLGVLYGNYMK